MLTFVRLRQLLARKLTRPPSAEVVPALESREAFDDLTASIISAAKAHDWDSAIATACRAGAMAERLGEPELLFESAKYLQRLEVFDRAWELFRAYQRLRWMGAWPEWQGEDLTGRTLLVRLTEYQAGDVLRYGRLIGHAASRARARRCIVLVEEAFIGLLQRNFPDVEFRVETQDLQAFVAQADAVASFETLCALFASDWPAIVRGFVPLHADPALVSEFRERYRANHGRPVIGVSWWSNNPAKDLPSVEDWADFMRRVPARFVSLQYGDLAAAVRHFSAAIGDRFVLDAQVDPLGDRHRFAAQIAALDLVVTIPQTCAHMAGALDVRTTVLLDDDFHLSWPQMRSETPWYPKTTLVRKRGRNWREVFGAVAERLG